MHPTLLRLIAKVVPLVFLGTALAVVTATVLLPKALGARPLTVLTGSMTPSIGVGSLVLVKPVDARAVEVGDVITYESAPGSGTYITHRVVEVLQPGAAGSQDEPASEVLRFVTKGDANAQNDSAPVVQAAVRGRVVLDVPHLGAFRDRLATPLGYATIGGVLLLGWWADRWRHNRTGLTTSRSAAVAGRLRLLSIPRRAAAAGRAVTAAAELAIAAPTMERAHERHELVLYVARVTADTLYRAQVLELAGVARAQVHALGVDSLVISYVGAPAQVDAFAELLSVFRVLDASRSAVLSVGTPEVAGGPAPAAGDVEEADVAAPVEAAQEEAGRPSPPQALAPLRASVHAASRRRARPATAP